MIGICRLFRQSKRIGSGFDRYRRIVIAGLIITAYPLISAAQQMDLTEIPLEELMRIEVTLATRQTEKLVDVAAAVYVLTREDIIQSGYSSIADVLRIVPGMEIGHIDANKWAVSVRGFNNLFANKLLVLMDGRTLYNPIFSGVVWDAQDVLFEDVAQIEVVRGPGGTLWGANAVNGIINIVTRSAEETQGGYVMAGGGNLEKKFAELRYGGHLGRMYYRSYLKFNDRSEYINSEGNPADDAWHMWRTGMRMDGRLSKRDMLTVTSEYFRNEVGYTLIMRDPDFIFTRNLQNQEFGGHILGRWQRTASPKSLWTFQLYYDTFKRRDPGMIEGRVSSVDFDFQHSKTFRRHTFVWGGGFRFTWDKFNNNMSVMVIPDKKQYTITNAFFQADRRLLDNRMHLIMGSKLEYNELYGWEIQPGVRLSYHVKNEGMFWTSVSRAVRTPARIDQDIVSEFIVGNPDVKSEQLMAFEIGSRFKPLKRLYLDLALYHHRYHRLITHEPLIAMNKKSGNVSGLEISADMQMFHWMKIRSGTSFGGSDFTLDADSRDPYSEDMNKEIPRYQSFVQIMMNLRSKWQWTVSARFVDQLKGELYDTDAYASLNSRLSFRPNKNHELSVTGQNLLEPYHSEFNALWLPFLASEVPRSVYCQWKCWF
ncbi:TonB-dependent receptor [bacterium]|nr:TonB-dependent receptor [bacterium]